MNTTKKLLIDKRFQFIGILKVLNKFSLTLINNCSVEMHLTGTGQG